VWFWRDGAIDVCCLRHDAYQRGTSSEVLPGLDVALVARLAVESPTVALAQLRASLNGP
jgi:hypothetical protein